MPFYLSGAPVVATQHFGANQTDLFSVGSTGQLGVASVVGAGAWRQPLLISPVNSLPPAAHLSASQQFGTSEPQTDVFVVDANGALNVFWSTQPGTSWKRLRLSADEQFPPGAPTAAAPQSPAAGGPPNQTDVFLVGSDGTLNVFFVVAGNAWASQKIGAAGTATPGTYVATSQRVGANGEVTQTDVFLVDVNGALNVYSVAGARQWEQKVISGAGVFAPASRIAVSRQVGAGDAGSGDQSDVFMFDNTGALQVFYAYGTSPWLNQTISVSGLASPGAPVQASQQFSPLVNQTDVVFVDKTGALSGYSVIGAGTWELSTISPPAVANPGDNLCLSRQFGSPNVQSPFQTDVFVIDRDGNLSIFYAEGTGPWNRYVLPPQANLPIAGLGSFRNIIFAAGSADLQALQVDIKVTEDIVPEPMFDPTGLPIGGVGFQLNCYSPIGEYEGGQQYIISMDPEVSVPALSWSVENFGTESSRKLFGNIDATGTLVELPDPSRFAIPAGYSLRLVLLPYRGTPYIGGAEYYVFDATGAQVGSYTLNLLQQTLKGADPNQGKNVTAVDLSPVVGFQLDIVAWAGGENTQLVSGAGLIEYTTGAGWEISPLEGSIPGFLTSQNEFLTGESSNCSYSCVPAQSGQSFVQSFQAVQT